MKTIPISGVIGWDVTAQSVRDALAEAKGDEIRAEFASPGGLVFDGLEIFNLFKNYDGPKSAHIMGLAASMASYLPLAFDRVTGEANTVFMIHNAWGMAIGDHREMRKAADISEGLSNILATAYAEKTGKGLDEIKADMDEETWLYGAEAVEYGLVDEIVGTSESAADKSAAMLAAKASLAAAQKLVAEFEGGDNLHRVAALVDVMTPKKPAAVKAQATPGPSPVISDPKGGSKKMTTLDQLKAESPEVYAQALALGVQAERDRVTGINRHAGTSAEAAKICAEAVAQGKTEHDILPELIAAAGRVTQENAPQAATKTSTNPSGGALDDIDAQAAAMFGYSAEDAHRFGKKKEA